MEVVLELLKVLPPWAVSIIVVVGTLRIFVKPVMEIVRAVVALTPSTSDDSIPDNVEKSKFYKTVMFVLDWFASIKPVKK